MGWKINGFLPDQCEKCVILAAPHTSNSDFYIGWLAYKALGIKVKFLIKKESFTFPFGILLKAAGGIPVDRSRSNNTVKQVVDIIDKHQEIHIVITPEGTRKLTKNWKKGFYFIAQTAKIPLVLAYIDYGRKEGGVGPKIDLTDNYDEDLDKIQSFYKNVTAKYPEQFNLSVENSPKFANNKEDVKKLQRQYCCKR